MFMDLRHNTRTSTTGQLKYVAYNRGGSGDINNRIFSVYNNMEESMKDRYVLIGFVLVATMAILRIHKLLSFTH